MARAAGQGAAEKAGDRPPRPPQALRNRARKIASALAREYPLAKTALDHVNPLQLLVATILSAQCTDERVNKVTPELFKRYPDAASLARARRPALERIVHSTGFFRNKAKSIQGAAQAIVERHGGEVPDTMEELLALPGVARKTANVVMGSAFGVASGVVVDTHVARISRLLELTTENAPEKIERDLMALLPRDQWIDFSHWLIHHGRRVCIARRPRCDACVLRVHCPSRRGESESPLHS